MKRIRIYFIGLLIIGVIILGFYFIKNVKNGFDALDNSADESLPSTYELIQNHIEVIAEPKRSLVSVNEIVRSKLRDPISFLFYDNKFDLIIYQFDIAEISSLERILSYSFKNIERSVGTTYRNLSPKLYFNFQYQADYKKGESNKLFFTAYGDSIRILKKNDSLAAFRGNLKNLSLRYAEKENYDIVVNGKEAALGFRNSIPAEIAFVTKNNSVFLLMLTPKSEQSFVPDSLILRLIDY